MPKLKRGVEASQFALQDRTLDILDQGDRLQLSFAQAEKFHQGNSGWGLAVAYRAMQLAAQQLSENSLWDRANLSVLSGHPGPGVRDGIDYVTACVRRNRYQLTDACAKHKTCHPDMQFEWQISDGKTVLQIRLRDDFVPDEFYTLIERLGSHQEREQDSADFERVKTQLIEDLWQESLSNAFSAVVTPL